MPELPKKLNFSIMKNYKVGKDQPIETDDQIYYPESIWNDLKLKLEEKEKQYSELSSDYHKLRKRLENEIDELKKELTGKYNKIKNLTEDVVYWRDLYQRGLAKWRIVPLEDEEFSYAASWLNPNSKKVETHYIPRDFNPHHIQDLKPDDNDYYTIDYYSDFHTDFISYRIPISLFEKIKEKIKPKPKKIILIEDLIGILREKGIEYNVTYKMKLVWGEIVSKEEISVTEISNNTDVSRDTIYRHLSDLLLKEDLVLKRGGILKVHPSVLDLTKN